MIWSGSPTRCGSSFSAELSDVSGVCADEHAGTITKYAACVHSPTTTSPRSRSCVSPYAATRRRLRWLLVLDVAGRSAVAAGRVVYCRSAHK